MSMQATLDSGCGSEHCGCRSESTAPTVTINGRALALHPDMDLDTVRELAWAELLRQEAVRQGRLDDVAGPVAPAMDERQQAVVEAMLEDDIHTPEPTQEACQRYYDANISRFRQGQAAQLRHILFAVTPGVPVQALAQRAEAVLMDVMRPDADPGYFAAQAQQWSNCPSGAQGGELGWLGPQDCAPELAQYLFFQGGGVANGIQPRLVHTRFGLHIVDIQEQKPGELLAFAQVQGRIAGELSLQSRVTAWRQYMQLLVGQAQIVGIELEGAQTPLVQ